MNKFIFSKRNFNLKTKELSFTYKLQTKNQTYDFTEKLTLPENFEILNKDDQILDQLLKNLHLILGISYWKLTATSDLDLGDIKLTKEEADFWNTVWTKGMGEFFYVNKIDFKNLINFPYEAQTSTVTSKLQPITQTSKSLLFFSGGKDSIVSAEILKDKKNDFTCFSVNPVSFVSNIQKLTNTNFLIVKRQIDPMLLALNSKQLFYNGHIPFNAILAFISLLVSYLYGFNFLITSNEESSNYPNVEYIGEKINHQWSKSFEFEKMFHDYVKKLLPNINYFSLLRNFSEYEISEKLTQYSKYLPYFSSCNRNFLIKPTTQYLKPNQLWCGNCPKCLFTFIMLSAFLPRIKVLEILGEDLLNKYELLQIFCELLGIDIKPFECVGTPDEVKLALNKIYEKKEFNNSILMTYFIGEILPTVNEGELEKNVINKKVENLIPEEIYENK